MKHMIGFKSTTNETLKENLQPHKPHASQYRWRFLRLFRTLEKLNFTGACFILKKKNLQGTTGECLTFPYRFKLARRN